MAGSEVLASLRDAGSFGGSVPVVSSRSGGVVAVLLNHRLRPVVSSLCSSTTGYML